MLRIEVETRAGLGLRPDYGIWRNSNYSIRQGIASILVTHLSMEQEHE